MVLHYQMKFDSFQQELGTQNPNLQIIDIADHWKILVDFIVLIFDPVCEEFTVELEDLKVCKQEKSFEQVIKTYKHIEIKV